MKTVNCFVFLPSEQNEKEMKRYITLCVLLLTALTASGRNVYPVNEGWRFFFSQENSSDNARIVTLPHTWNTDAMGGRSGVYLQTSAIYQNEVFIPADWRNKRLFLKFYGVQSVADLFVNGYHTGEHRGGATAFTFEITDKVKWGSENSLRVDVSNAKENDVLPTSADMNLYGGIYRNVELIVTDRTAISPLYLGSDGVLIHPKTVTDDRVEGEAEIHLTSAVTGSMCTVTLEITTPDGYQAFIRSQKARIDGKPAIIPFSFEEPMLWSPDSPALYTVRARVENEGQKDEVSLRTGFRDIRVTPKEGFMLNGKRLNIKGVSLYHDNMGAGSAFTEADYDADLALIRAMGANALRSAVMPHAQYLYDRCDSDGMLAWVDLPFQRAPFLGDMAYFATSRFEENGRQQLREMIAQLTNHPSVAMWGLFSCLLPRGDDVLPYLRTLNNTAHTMDSSRPTVACSDQNGDINFITDLIVWQQNVGWDRGSACDVKLWSDLLRKSWSHLRSGVCYGAEGMMGHRNFEALSTARTNWLPDNRQRQFHEEYARNLDRDSLFWGVWINNMFDFGSARRPYGLNSSGLVSLDRRHAKDAYYLYKTLWNKAEPTLHIADRHRLLQSGEARQFKVYAQETPTLIVNRDTVTMHEWAPCQFLSDTVIVSGRCVVRALAGGLSDHAEFTTGSVLKQRPQQAPQRRVSLPPIN